MHASPWLSAALRKLQWVAPVGIVTGSGSYTWAELERSEPELVETGYGAVELTRGELAGCEILHLARHGRGHVRLSSGVDHRANLAALARAGARCVVSFTICGGVDPTLEPGTLIVFDELHFPANRLPDGSLCTLFSEPGDRDRGHWIAGEPFAEDVRGILLDAAEKLGVPVRDGGCYGHVDGPRFNTRTEIAALAAIGVTAVSQTGGPETVLAGELELPFALVGYVTDRANGVAPELAPLEDLVAHMESSRLAFSRLAAASVTRLASESLRPAGFVYRWEPRP